MKYGVAGNGRSGRWYVEVETQCEEWGRTEEYVLQIEAANGFPLHDEIRFAPIYDAVADIDHLIAALQQARQDLISKE